MSHTGVGLRSPRALLYLALWYIFSAFNLFLNKYVVSYMQTDAIFLGYAQVVMTVVCGGVHLWLTAHSSTNKSTSPPLPNSYFVNMFLIGSLTSGVILFGLLALSYVAVSFAETVKSSAPLVTVIVSWLVLGERAPLRVSVSLLPVMAGLALCSLHELSFSGVGFLCAMTTNLCECLQSVFVKKMLNSKSYTYKTAELQMLPGVFSMVLLAPVLLVRLASSDSVAISHQMAPRSLLVLSLAGIFYYGQTAAAYVLMHYISPLTYSVANTTKRALLIWLSVLLFHNQVTVFSGLGTAVVIFGVFVYNAASSRHNVASVLPAPHAAPAKSAQVLAL